MSSRDCWRGFRASSSGYSYSEFEDMCPSEFAQTGNAKIQELRSQTLDSSCRAKGALFSYLTLAFLRKFQTSSSGIVRVRQKSTSKALSATLKGKGPVGGAAENVQSRFKASLLCLSSAVDVGGVNVSCTYIEGDLITILPYSVSGLFGIRCVAVSGFREPRQRGFCSSPSNHLALGAISVCVKGVNVKCGFRSRYLPLREAKKKFDRFHYFRDRLWPDECTSSSNHVAAHHQFPDGVLAPHLPSLVTKKAGLSFLQRQACTSVNPFLRPIGSNYLQYIMGPMGFPVLNGRAR
ncbi:hypothetical protein B0H14DRAFT_2572624 [Mycena olivaceomarginata]|nr:hypothetical protein B0H14DRAFT_2572624 [Mycena olivaceomarginata]